MTTHSAPTAPPELVFDAEAHTYWLGSERLPSVTEIIKPLQDFGSVPAFILERKAWIGTVVHATTELYDRGELAEYDPEIEGYLEAWRKFTTDYQPEWTGIEMRVHHPRFGYAGTIDRFGFINGELTVVDLKTSAQLYPEVAIQLAGYAMAAPREDAVIPDRMAVRLTADGDYETESYPDERGDCDVFLNCLAIYRWREAHAEKPQPKRVRKS